eukprot:CAMPEP_0168569982 /NCGR_PEP_ID=MMETSP0413-20121227/16473_1 /TAXON_ID=136452 /ORGANISM="Filamoeba nolandi, Strain NC-AS-23-1" /LENGTH=127 /DNA_ID=CAMNT_0008602565 /DNA_START=35 /DNA_END=415 /DNA_ORIENTATION=+
MSQEQIIQHYKQLKAEHSAFAQKIHELNVEVTEHNLVIGAIEKLEPSRRCYRLIGGVLVERTVGEVLPAVQKNKEGIEEITKTLAEQMNKKAQEINDFVVKYKLVGHKDDEEAPQEKSSKPTSSGVL